MTYTAQEQKLIKTIQKERKLEVKRHGEYVGYAIPSNHPDNELSKEQKQFFNQERKIAEGLVKKKVLQVTSQCRRITGYDLREEV